MATVHTAHSTVFANKVVERSDDAVAGVDGAPPNIHEVLNELADHPQQATQRVVEEFDEQEERAHRNKDRPLQPNEQLEVTRDLFRKRLEHFYEYCAALFLDTHCVVS